MPIFKISYTFMMKYLKTIIIVAIIIAGVGLSINRIQAQNGKNQTLKFDQKKDTIYNPKIDSIQDVLTLAGSIDTDQIASVRFKNSGKLVWVGVKVGDKVKKGQALASIDKKELEKSLKTQFNNYRTQLSQFDDTNDQYKPQKEALLVTDTIKRILVRTQNSLDNSVINYELADMAIKDSVLTSPLAGIVSVVDQPFSGTNITPASASFTIINPNSLYLKAEIDQEAITKVKIGQPVILKLDSFPDKTIDSKIKYIAFTPVTGQSSTVYEIRFEIPITNNNDLSYRIGMDGDASIVLNQANDTLTIPTDAVNDDNGQRYVYLKTNNTLTRRDIKTGIENDSTTQVTEGLTTNDQVVVIQK